MGILRLNSIKLVLVLTPFIWACAEKKSGSKSLSSSPEQSNCSQTTVNNPVSITGTAEFQVRVVTDQGLVGNATKPIRYAEVRVKNSSGKIIQCGETSETGTFSLSVAKPSSTTKFTIEVNSRSYGSYAKASILNNTTENEFYTLTSTATVGSSDSTTSVGVLTATYNGNIYGGAFNILDQIVTVNKFLRTNINEAITTAFTVAPKVTVFWTPGFTPGAYFGSAHETDAISFFDASGSISSGPSLFVLGGVGGNVTTSDTDHFDNSVIIHEYGHFLEYAYAHPDSPGGSHDGNFIIDPRLAWSEGFADFLPSAVNSDPAYIDTRGTGVGIILDLENPTSDQDIAITRNPAGEGNFREVSVSRSLYDLIDTNNDSYNTHTDTLSLDFSYLWEAFSDPSLGLKNGAYHFRSLGHFYSALNYVIPAGDRAAFDEILAMESQRKDTLDWGKILYASTGSCGTTEIKPSTLLSKMMADGSTSEFHNLFLSNDFYQFYHSGGALQISLVYTRKIGSPQTDLDLYVYKEDFNYRDSNSVLTASDKEIALESPSGQEVAKISNAPAGYYMINVSSYETQVTASKGADYYLKVGSIYLCP